MSQRRGLAEFSLGFAMVVLAGFALLDSVKISGGLWRAFGLGSRTAFSLVMLLVLMGLVVVYFAGSERRYGWSLWAAGTLALLAGIFSNARVYWCLVPPVGTLAAAALFAGGMGMILLALRRPE